MAKLVQKIFIYSFASITIAGCNNAGANNSDNSGINNNKNNTRVIKANSPTTNSKSPFMIGGTYDSMSIYPTSTLTCLNVGNKVDNLQIVNPQAYLNFSQQQSLRSIQQALGIDISVRVGWGAFSVTTNYQYAKSTQDDDYSMNLNYIYEYGGKVKFKPGISLQGESILTPHAKQLLHASATNFRTECGTGFVAEMDAGASVLINLNLKFHSHIDKNYFDSTFNKISGLNTILTAIQTNPHKVAYELTASGLQVGGNPQLLNNLFLSYPGSRINSDGYPVLSCSNANEANCVDLINYVIDYVKSLKSQLVLPTDYYLSAPVITKWNNAGIDPGLTYESAAILNAMNEITQTYEIDLANYNFINNYLYMLENKKDNLNNQSLLSEAMKNDLQQLQQQYQDITNLYTNPVYRVLDCYNGFVSNECLAIRDKLFDKRRDLLKQTSLQQFLAYLKDNQYMVQLLINPDAGFAEDPISSCMLVPISDANNHLFMINCDGQVSGSLDPQSGISVYFINDNVLNINNFNYSYLTLDQLFRFNYEFPNNLTMYNFYSNAFSGFTMIKVNGQDYISIDDFIIVKTYN